MLGGSCSELCREDFGEGRRFRTLTREPTPTPHPGEEIHVFLL